MSKANCEEHPRSILASTSSVTRSQEDYKSQVSEEIEGRFTKKLSQEISRTETRILGALARLDDFLMNPLLQGHSGTTPETSRKVFSINQGSNEDDSQSDPHPEAGLLTCGREDRHDMATGIQRESTQAHDRNHLDLTGCMKFGLLLWSAKLQGFFGHFALIFLAILWGLLLNIFRRIYVSQQVHPTIFLETLPVYFKYFPLVP